MPKHSISFLWSVLAAGWIVLGHLGSTPAVAKDARVVVTAKGESFGSVPKFRLWADARLIGEAQLARLPDASDGAAMQSGAERSEHYGGQFEFIVPNIERVRFLGMGFARSADSSEGKFGVRSLTITGIAVDGVPLDPRAMQKAPATAAATDAGQEPVTLSAEGLFRLKRPAGGWTRRTALKASESEKLAKEAAQIEEKRRKAEAARNAEW
jgi:hypothetical protein